MNQLLAIIPLMCVIVLASAQRAPFAGSRPNGYKDKLQTSTANINGNNNVNVNNNGIADRFGENANTGVISTAVTTEKLPHLALGDREIVDRLNTFPVDQRPFWLINAQAIENQKNPGSRPTNPANQNSAGIANRFGSGSGTTTVSSGNRPNYPSVVYPIEMTPDQQKQAQQIFNDRIQQIVDTKNNNNVQLLNSNALPSRIGAEKPVIVAHHTNVNGPEQFQQHVQGRLPHSGSGYNGR